MEIEGHSRQQDHVQTSIDAVDDRGRCELLKTARPRGHRLGARTGDAPPVAFQLRVIVKGAQRDHVHRRAGPRRRRRGRIGVGDEDVFPAGQGITDDIARRDLALAHGHVHAHSTCGMIFGHGEEQSRDISSYIRYAKAFSHDDDDDDDDDGDGSILGPAYIVLPTIRP